MPAEGLVTGACGGLNTFRELASAGVASVQQPVIEGEEGEFDLGGRTRLVEETRHVMLDRILANLQVGGDLAVGATVDDALSTSRSRRVSEWNGSALGRTGSC